LQKGDFQTRISLTGSKDEIFDLAADVNKMAEELEKNQRRKIQEVQRKKSEEILFETIPNPVITFDQNNKFVDCNQKFVDILGFSKDEIIGKNARDFLAEESEKTYRDIIQPSLNEGKPLMDIDLQVKKKDGSSFHALWSHIQNLDDNNEYMGFTAIGLDLTEIDKLREKLIKKERFSAIGELAARLSHELRNPLAIIKNTQESMLKRNPNLNQNQVDRMKRAIDRMTHQIEGVMDFVRIRKSELISHSASKILNVVINSATIPTNIKINLPENDAQILCDDKQCEILFYNVIINAIQAIGKNDGIISIRIKEQNNSVFLEIEDSGSGISEESLEQIFEPLFTTKQQGTGLGLSSCKNIIEQFGG